MWSAMAAVVVAAGGIAGCSGVPGEAGEAELAGDATFEEVGEVTAALNSDLNCGEANANKSFSSIMSPSFTSPSTYSAGANGCSRAYFTRISNYLGGNSGKYNYFKYGGPTPTTAAACVDTRLMVYVYERKSDGTVAFVENKSAYGTVFNDLDGNFHSCNVPQISVENRCWDRSGWLQLSVGKTYQFAVSARTNNAGTPVMQPIIMNSGNQVRCEPR
jgi:hypothetical protein